MNSKLYLGPLAVLSACAAPVYEGKFAFDEGWRVGTVTEVGAAGAIDEASTKDCREELARSSTAGRTFARVTFQYLRTFRAVIAPVADGSHLHPGDLAYVNMDHCDRDVVAKAR